MKKEAVQSKYTFGGTQSFSLRQLWPLKAYNFSLKRANEKIVFKNKDAILELGVGANMTASIQYWAKAINVLDEFSQVTPFARKLFGTPESPGLVPYLEKIDNIWLFHYFMCREPTKFTAAWFLFNRFTCQTFTKEDVLEELQEFVSTEYTLGNIKHQISKNTLLTDINTVFNAYAPLTHDVGVLRKQVKKLDNIATLCDTPLRQLNLISSNINELTFNIGHHLELSPDVVAFCLFDFFMNTQHNLVTMDIEKIINADGSIGKLFKLDKITLITYLQQLSTITQNALMFIEQNGLQQVICTIQPEKYNELRETLLERIYHNGKQTFKRTNFD